MNLCNLYDGNFSKLVNEKKIKKILILTGKKSFYKSGAKSLIKQINNKKIIKYIFKKSYLPNLNELKKINIEVKKFTPDLIIGIGGGSVIDYSKIVSVLENNTNLEKKIKKNDFNFKNKKYKLLAIPTTAGSGAEVTSNAVIYINKIKYSFESKYLIPDYYILIPELIISNPLSLKTSSGFDAIAQAIESIISKKSNSKSILYAKKSLKLSLNYYLKFIKKSTWNNSWPMSLAANLSGKAINISKTTAPHAISYPFTAYFNISHGHAVSLTIEKFLLFNFINIKNSNCNFNLKQRYQILFDIFGVKNIAALIEKIKYFKRTADLEDDFKKLKIDVKKNLNKIIGGVNLLRLKNNPIDLDKSDLENIILNT